MRGRLTVIQGGRSSGARSAAARPLDTARIDAFRPVILRPGAVAEPAIAAWRALADSVPDGDPLADPDILLTAARHGPRLTDNAFALVYGSRASGGDVLVAVLPLELPHPVWGRAAVGLWHPSQARRPVQPMVRPGFAIASVEAILSLLCAKRPEARLVLGRLAPDGALVRDLASDGRFRVETQTRPTAVRAASFVDLRPVPVAEEIVRVEAPDAIRDAVERFLVVDARTCATPVLADAGETATVRVATRLLARRGRICCEFGRCGGEWVSAAIDVGPVGARIRWLGPDTALGAGLEAGVDLTVGLAAKGAPAVQAAPVGLVGASV